MSNKKSYTVLRSFAYGEGFYTAGNAHLVADEVPADVIADHVKVGNIVDSDAPAPEAPATPKPKAGVR